MIQFTKCMLCKRWDVVDGKEVCEAFPKGIPEEIKDQPEDAECCMGIKYESGAVLRKSKEKEADETKGKYDERLIHKMRRMRMDYPL